MISLGAVGCASNPPEKEYTIAKTALEAARKSESARFAPSEFHHAEESYRKGEIFFKRGDFGDAKRMFNDSVEYSEQAEDAARIQRSKTGDDIP